MPDPYNNNGTVFYNQNICKSYTQAVGTAMVALCTQPCSEVFISNTSTTAANYVYIFDNGKQTAADAFKLMAGKDVTIRGITSTSMVSASAILAAQEITYRAAYFSLLPAR